MPNHITGKTDENLVVYYQTTQDKYAVGELFKRHSLMCLAVCNKYLKDEAAAQDAAMSIFEKLFNDLQNHKIQNFKSWLHSVCRNYCLMQLRKPNLLLSIPEPDEDENSFMEFSQFLHPEENETEKELRLQILEEAVATLKDKQKICIELFYLQQKSYDEICSLTGYTLNEVKSQIQNGKRNLKISLNQKGITLVIAIITWIHHTA